MEPWVRTERLYSGRVFNVVVGEARLSDGTVVPREMVEHPAGKLEGGLEPERRLDFDERIETVRIPISEIEGRMKAGEFPDAKTFIRLQALLAHLAQHPEPAR